MRDKSPFKIYCYNTMSYIKHADCFDEFKNIKPNTIDLVCVDLPYGQTDCGWDSCIDLKQMWVELKKICKRNCIISFLLHDEVRV